MLVPAGDSLGALRVCAIIVKSAGLCDAADPFGLQWPLKPADLLSRPLLSEFAEHLHQLGIVTGGESGAAAEHPGVPQSAGAVLVHRAAQAGSSGALRVLRPELVESETKNCLDHALLAAAANGHCDAAVLLMEMNASPHSVNPHGASVLHLAAGAAQSARLVKLLLEASANTTSTDKDKQIPLHYAARLGACNQALEALSQSNVHRGGQRNCTQDPSLIDRKDSWGRTALFWGAINGIRPVVSHLLAEGADGSIVDSQGENAKDAAHRRAQCSAQSRAAGLGSSVYGDIATLLGGSGKTKSFKK